MLPVPFAKAPNRLSISYPFSSSPLLQEQVLPFHTCTCSLTMFAALIAQHSHVHAV